VGAAAQSSTTIRITWAASSDTGGSGLAGYRVYRATTSGGTYSLISGTLSTASLSFDDTSLTAATTRYYRVSAVDGNNNESAQSSVVSATTSSSGSWQLPATNYVAAKQSMIRIYPRPDAETSSSSRHRWAYYDGSNSVEYRIPIGVAFGAPPFHFEITAGPSGMAIGQTYGAANYGIVTWTPSGSETNRTCTVRVTDQQSNTLDITWTVTTSSSTSRFIFVNRDTGSDSNSGAIGSPKQSISNVFGSTYATTANAGAHVYLRGSGSAYTMPLYSDGEINSSYLSLQFNTTRKPMSLMAYPGESVTITGNRLVSGASASDMFLQGLTFDGFPTVGNPRLFWFWSSRTTFDSISWINASIGTSQTDNATMLFGSRDGGASYNYIHSCSESGRVAGGDNNYGLCSVYSQQYLLIERCTLTGACGKGLYLKGTNVDATVRYNTITLTNAGSALLTGFAPDGFSNRIEICYNKVKTSGGISRYAFESSMSTLWHYRNSYYDTNIDVWAPASGGPYVFESNAIASNASPIVDTGSQITNLGTECQGTIAVGIMDSASLQLTGSFRTNHLGRRGHEVSA
jgi:hypothetical protein